ncbi:MAG: MFS transporter [Rhodospirillaceae bacterium]|jgi:MFS transporter, DHA1 family, tetracycline resistance protein|nr:MFS transporter [Rhodospirillaceae bacterium]MBT3495408.1 MFS transporter [Rhodospirillaceae bacterium]MBT3782704.1 MFS transporter [Rhodospirillaceae bacterium]MBT3975549.1 MFS transporter [Rhodospirillaceae bacterium]MBT4170537.1 MFS transporter [Rhodospirillaceae bacterium]
MFVLLLTVFVDLVGFGIVLPILPFYAQAYDASAVQITLLVSVHSGMQIISSPIWGRLSDRYGRKNILLLTLAGGGLAFLWFGYAGSLMGLFLARGLSGAMAGNIAVAQAYLADITTTEDRAGAMGRFGAAFGLGFVVGPVLGGLMIGAQPSLNDFALPCLVAAAFSLAAIVLGLIMLREPQRRQSKEGGKTRLGQLAAAVRANGIPPIIGLNFLVTFAFTALMALLPLWCQARLGWGPPEVSYAYAYIGLLVAALHGLLVGPLTRTFGEPRLLFLGAISLSTGMLSMPWIDGIASFAGVVLLLCMGTSFCHPVLTAMISQRADGDHQGTVMGATSSIAALGRICSPPLAGLLFSQLGPNWPMLMGGIIVLPVAVAAAWMSLKFERRQDQ